VLLTMVRRVSSSSLDDGGVDETGHEHREQDAADSQNHDAVDEVAGHHEHATLERRVTARTSVLLVDAAAVSQVERTDVPSVNQAINQSIDVGYSSRQHVVTSQ